MIGTGEGRLEKRRKQREDTGKRNLRLRITAGISDGTLESFEDQRIVSGLCADKFVWHLLALHRRHLRTRLQNGYAPPASTRTPSTPPASGQPSSSMALV